MILSLSLYLCLLEVLSKLAGNSQEFVFTMQCSGGLKFAICNLSIAMHWVVAWWDPQSLSRASALASQTRDLHEVKFFPNVSGYFGVNPMWDNFNFMFIFSFLPQSANIFTRIICLIRDISQLWNLYNFVIRMLHKALLEGAAVASAFLQKLILYWWALKRWRSLYMQDF